MIDKRWESAAAAVAGIPDGATIMIEGFGEAGSPIELIHALIGNGQVRKMICSYPRSANSVVFPEVYRRDEIELKLVPQGTLVERIRCGGAGVPAFYTPTAVGTVLADGVDPEVAP